MNLLIEPSIDRIHSIRIWDSIKETALPVYALLLYLLERRRETKMSIPPLAATLGALSLAIISNGFAMAKPLISIEGFYDLHLFPERDHFDYTVSETHKASQAMHMISFFALTMAFLMSFGNIFYTSANNVRDRVPNRITIIATSMIGLGSVCYVAGIACLLKMAVDYKHIGDDLPLPTPDAHMKSGAIMDIVGVISSILAFIFVMLAVVRSERGGLLRLE